MKNALIQQVLTGEDLAKKFHTYYEELAPAFNYQTRKASAVKWEDVPENNKKLMIATCEEILDFLCRAEAVERMKENNENG